MFLARLCVCLCVCVLLIVANGNGDFLLTLSLPLISAPRVPYGIHSLQLQYSLPVCSHGATLDVCTLSYKFVPGSRIVQSMITYYCCCCCSYIPNIMQRY